MVVHPLLKGLWLVVANWGCWLLPALTVASAAYCHCYLLSVLPVASAVWASRDVPWLLPVLAVTPVIKKGGGVPVALPLVPTILGEPIPTTEVVDSNVILVGIIAKISEPVTIQGAGAIVIGIGCSIAWEGGGGIPPSADGDLDQDVDFSLHERVEE